jgi:hypothetical protein
MHMTFSSRLALLPFFSVTLAPALAAADEAPAEAPRAAHAAGRGLALGFDNGVFGRGYEQGLRIRIPILEHFAFGLRGVSAFGDRSGDFTWYVGGRAELIGHSPVFLNLVRLYGAGGPEVVTRVHGSGGDKTLIGGGGQFGFEFFLQPKMSFFVEIGGRAGDDVTGGGTAIAGMMLYPFSDSPL